jgi:hypothetical protein
MSIKTSSDTIGNRTHDLPVLCLNHYTTVCPSERTVYFQLYQRNMLSQQVTPSFVLLMFLPEVITIAASGLCFLTAAVNETK